MGKCRVIRPQCRYGKRSNPKPGNHPNSSHPEQGLISKVGYGARRTRAREARMRNKNIGLLAGIIVVLGVVAGVTLPKLTANEPAATPAPTASAQVVNKEIVSFTGTEGKTALASLKEQHSVETKATTYGDMVVTINGLAADDTHYWAFYVNGVMANEGAGTYVPKTGDTLEFRWEKF